MDTEKIVTNKIKITISKSKHIFDYSTTTFCDKEFDAFQRQKKKKKWSLVFYLKKKILPKTEVKLFFTYEANNLEKHYTQTIGNNRRKKNNSINYQLLNEFSGKQGGLLALKNKTPLFKFV